MFRQPHSVMFYVDDIPEAVRWYSRLLSKNPENIAPDFPVILIGETFICFHKSDEKGKPALGGSVVYWDVGNLDRALERCTQLGATLHRGTLEIESEKHICQVKDPFGNLIGLVGTRKQTN